MFYKEIIEYLRANQSEILPDLKIVKKQPIGPTLTRLASYVYSDLAYLLPFMNQHLEIDGAPASEDLGFDYIKIEDSLQEMVRKIYEFRN